MLTSRCFCGVSKCPPQRSPRVIKRSYEESCVVDTTVEATVVAVAMEMAMAAATEMAMAAAMATVAAMATAIRMAPETTGVTARAGRHSIATSRGSLPHQARPDSGWGPFPRLLLPDTTTAVMVRDTTTSILQPTLKDTNSILRRTHQPAHPLTRRHIPRSRMADIRSMGNISLLPRMGGSADRITDTKAAAGGIMALTTAEVAVVEVGTTVTGDGTDGME